MRTNFISLNRVHIIFLNSFIFFSSLFVSKMTIASEVSPCKRPTLNINQNASETLTAIESLNNYNEVVKGSAYNMAECKSVDNSNVTACLSIADGTFNNNIWLVFDIYGEQGEDASRGALITHGDKKLDSESDSDFSNSNSELYAMSSYINNGVGKFGISGGFKKEISYDKYSGKLTYKSYDGSRGFLGLFAKWKLRSQKEFICKLIN